jgi:hypothetical protein
MSAVVRPAESVSVQVGSGNNAATQRLSSPATWRAWFVSNADVLDAYRFKADARTVPVSGRDKELRTSWATAAAVKPL